MAALQSNMLAALTYPDPQRPVVCTTVSAAVSLRVFVAIGYAIYYSPCACPRTFMNARSVLWILLIVLFFSEEPSPSIYLTKILAVSGSIGISAPSSKVI